jgi:hypothetical protein
MITPTHLGTWLFDIKIDSANYPATVTDFTAPQLTVIIQCFLNALNPTSEPLDHIYTVSDTIVYTAAYTVV